MDTVQFVEFGDLFPYNYYILNSTGKVGALWELKDEILSQGEIFGEDYSGNLYVKSDGAWREIARPRRVTIHKVGEW